jgi:hypothetical protein
MVALPLMNVSGTYKSEHEGQIDKRAYSGVDKNNEPVGVLMVPLEVRVVAERKTEQLELRTHR